MPIARAMSAKFKAFSFPVIKSYSVVPVFRSSVIPHFPVSPIRLSLFLVLVTKRGPLKVCFPFGLLYFCIDTDMPGLHPKVTHVNKGAGKE